MSEINVRELTEQEFEDWDRLLISSPNGSVFLRSDFIHMLCETDPSLKLTYLGCFDTYGDLKAGQAILYRQFMGMFIGFDSTYFYNGPVLPPAMNNPRSSKAEIDRTYLTSLANEMSSRFPDISVDTHPSLTDMRPFIRLGWRVSLRYTHIWNLTESRDVYHKMNQGERKRIHRGQRNYTFQQETWKETGHKFIEVHQKTMNKQDWQPSDTWNRVFYKRVQWMEDHGLCILTTARDTSNELVGAFLTILSREDQTAYFWKLGYDLGQEYFGIVPALYYAAFAAVPEEFTRIDMAEGMTNGQSIFKDRMGTDLVPYYVITPPKSREIFINVARNIRRKTLTKLLSPKGVRFVG